MGDRALVIFHRNKNDFSPVVYLHWSGTETPKYLKAAGPHLRAGDTDYAAARFVGYCHEQIGGNYSLGIFNSPETLARIEEEDFSHGDAGVFLVNVDNGEVEQFHGYPADGNEDEDRERPTPQNPVRFKIEMGEH